MGKEFQNNYKGQENLQNRGINPNVIMFDILFAKFRRPRLPKDCPSRSS